MNRPIRLAVLSLLVPVLALPSGAAGAEEASSTTDGPLCWVLGWACDDDDDDDDDGRDTPVAVLPARGTLIQGVAVDSSGKGIDNVAVQALDASTGKPAATALTYASPRRTGPQHGYFFLHVPRGVYDVVLVKRGYDASFLSDVNVTGRKAVSLGHLELDVRDWPTSTVAEVLDPVVAPRQSVVVSAVVASRRAKVTGGRVTVREGRKVLASHSLKRRDKGLVTLDLGRLSRGTHQLVVVYQGAEGLEASTSRTVRVVVARTVKAARAGRPLPR